MQHDVAIIGGGIAGSQAALTLARARYKVVLIDAGEPRHRFSSHMHNMVGADGLTPAEFYGAVQEQLANYPNLTRVKATITAAGGNDGAFTLTDEQGETYAARKLLFACGVEDLLPGIEGLAEHWGREVQHCAYCHGYEARDGAVAVLTSLAQAEYHLSALRYISRKLHFFFPGEPLPEELAASLAPFGVTFDNSPVVRVAKSGSGLTIMLENGQVRTCDTLFLTPRFNLRSDVPFDMGCKTDASHWLIATDDGGLTSIPGVYAAGDAATQHHQLGAALHSGLVAGSTIEAVLAGEDIGRVLAGG